MNNYEIEDDYCWYCHKAYKDCSCSTCSRSFHIECIQKHIDGGWMTHYESIGFTCPICVHLEKKSTLLDKGTVSRLLKYLMEKKLRDDTFQQLMYMYMPYTYTRVISLNEIIQKINERGYDSLHAFLVDIESIEHHCFSNNFIYASVSSILVKLCQSEVQIASSCITCFVNKYTKPDEWHTLVCDYPHPVLWVKFDDETAMASESGAQTSNLFWPAKLFSVDDKMNNVVIFGRSELVKIPTKNCFQYNKQSSIQTSNSKCADDAQRAADSYRENLARKFGEDKLQLMQATFSEYNGGSQDDANALEPMHSIDSDGINEYDEWLQSEFDESDENSEESEIEDVNDYRPQEGEPIMKKQIAVNSGNIDQLTIQQMRQKLISLTKSLADCKANNDDLVHQLIAITDERDQAVLNAKNELVQLKEDHAREIMALNEERSKEVAAAKMEMEKYKEDMNTNSETVIEELCHAEDQLKALCLQLESSLKFPRF